MLVTDTVGERLKAIRQKHRLTQQELANQVNERHGLGWFQSTVQKNEANTRPLTLVDLQALADVFGMGLDDMLYGHWYGANSLDDAPVFLDPADQAAWDRNDSYIQGLRYERQFHVQRIAEIDEDLARRTEYPGDIPNPGK